MGLFVLAEPFVEFGKRNARIARAIGANIVSSYELFEVEDRLHVSVVPMC